MAVLCSMTWNIWRNFQINYFWWYYRYLDYFESKWNNKIRHWLTSHSCFIHAVIVNFNCGSIGRMTSGGGRREKWTFKKGGKLHTPTPTKKRVELPSYIYFSFFPFSQFNHFKRWFSTFSFTLLQLVDLQTLKGKCSY